MIKPKIRLVKVESTQFDEQRFISDLIAKAKLRAGSKNVGKQKTLKEYLYPSSSLTDQSDIFKDGKL